MSWRTSSYSSSIGECIAVWEKSSYSHAEGNRLEWRKSSYSHSNLNGTCLEAGNGILVRDSKLGEDSPVLSFTPSAWDAFIRGLKAR